MDDAARGRRLAETLPKPKVQLVKGVRMVTQHLQGLNAHELRALSEHYRRKYGDGSNG